jgi:hypothetical protein
VLRRQVEADERLQSVLIGRLDVHALELGAQLIGEDVRDQSSTTEHRTSKRSRTTTTSSWTPKGGDTLAKSLRVLKPGGTAIGTAAGPRTQTSPANKDSTSRCGWP